MANPVLMILTPRWLAITLVLFSGLAASHAAEPAPQVVAHRGLLMHAPENTLANFRACLELRIGFEFDVARSRDGHLVCIHDNTVDRTTNGRGNVADMTLAELRRLDAGTWFAPEFAGERIPTVQEVLSLLREYRQHPVLIAVDLKAADVEQEVTRLAVEAGVLDRLLFIGRTISEPVVRERIRQVSPQAHVATVTNNPAEFQAALAAPHSDWVYFRYLPSPQEIQAVQQAGKRSFIAGKTVAGHLPENWQQATSAGINAILTDFPLELRAQLRLNTPGQ